MTIPEPNKILVPFADSGLKNSIPANANNTTGKAGFDKGFPERTMLPKVSGGIPPSGMDFNGILYDITSAIRYMQAGGKPTYDAAFAAAIGGYPSGAVLIGDDGVSVFQNAVAGNETDPNSGGAGWTRPDLQMMELYRRSYAEAGYNLIDGSFEAGGTLVNANDVLLQGTTGKAFSGTAGSVVAGTDPLGPRFVDRSGDITVDVGTYASLRSYAGSASKIRCLGRSNLLDRASGFFVLDTTDTSTTDDDATVLVGVSGRRWKRQFNGDADVRWWGAKDFTNSDVAFQNAADYSNKTGKRIWVEGEFHLDSSILCGSEQSHLRSVHFIGPNFSSQNGETYGAKLRFSGTDGFRVVKRTQFHITNIFLDGDRGVRPPADYKDYLLSLSKSAIRSSEDTMDANCFTFITGCFFTKWKYGLDFSRGSWSSNYIQNTFFLCYQAGLHFRPHSAIHHRNTVFSCIRGFHLIEQSSGQFTENELNSGKYTEYQLKLTRPQCGVHNSNYMEHQEGVTTVDAGANWGLGFIPIIVELDRFMISEPVIDNNLINSPSTQVGILYVQAPGQENNHYGASAKQPENNTIIGVTNPIAIAAIGTGAVLFSRFVLGKSPKTVALQLNGATGKAMAVGPGASAKMVKTWVRADIATASASNSPVCGAADIVYDTTNSVGPNGLHHGFLARTKPRIEITVTATTDATPAKIRLTVAKWGGAAEEHFHGALLANETKTFTFVYYPVENSINEDYSVRFNDGITAHPTSMKITVRSTYYAV